MTPGLVVVLSGKKLVQINNYRMEYGPENYFFVATPYPMTCEAIASKQTPILGFYIKLQPELIYKQLELLQQGGRTFKEDSKNFPVGFDVINKTSRLDQCMSRILTALHSKLETQALMPGILEELYFLLLTSEQGQLLANFTLKDTAHFKISKAVNYINDHFEQKLSVVALADVSGMSTSAFHRAFKHCITESPLQYLKKIRLNQAKTYLIKDGKTISEVALKVGYESIPQFSREFKRYFGLPPSQANDLDYRDFVG